MFRSRNIPVLVSVFVALLVIGGIVAVMLRPTRGVAEDQQPLLEYPEYPPTPTIGPNPTSAPSLASVPLASADFATADALNSWQAVDLEFVLPDSKSNWTIVDGRLAQNMAGQALNPSTLQTALLTGDAAWADYRVKVSFYDEFNGTAGLIARYSGSDPLTASYYRYRILKDSFEATPKQVLEKVVGGVATPLAELNAPGYSERAWHTMEFSVVGGQLTVWLDGTAVLEATDSAPLTAGQAGVYSRAMGGIFFDDFTVVQ